MLKIKVRYPYTVINEIDIEVDETKLQRGFADLCELGNQVEIINANVPGYEQTHITLCRGASECDLYWFRIQED